VTSQTLQLVPEGLLGPWTAAGVWMTTLDDAGVKVRSGVIPCALLVDHGDHTMLVPWVPVDGAPGEPFTLERLVPLTLTEQVTCMTCGVSGRIRRGLWLSPTEGGDGGV
jgi:hypothetical protein